MTNSIPLSATLENIEYTITDISPTCPIKRRLCDMGIVTGKGIKKLYSSPFGDPCAYLICGTLIAIRKIDAQNILVTAHG